MEHGAATPRWPAEAVHPDQIDVARTLRNAVFKHARALIDDGQDKPVGDGDASIVDILAEGSDFVEKTTDFLSLAEATKKLSSREKYILLMRYYKNKTQAQVAEILGVSQVQVSRLEKKIIENLRKEIV